MAFDLKAATPDTSFAWATAAFFGADSQAAANPSYFPASDVRTALLALANTWAGVQTFSSGINGPVDANMFAFSTVKVLGALSIDGLFGSGGSVLFNGVNSGVGLSLAANYPMSWSDSIGVGVGANYAPLNIVDLQLRRDAADTLAQRRGTNAQTLRWYHTFTDLSNRQNGALKTAAGYVELAAETAGTGADDIDVLLTPAGTGNVRFGTVTGNADAAITGYVTIKDAAGAAVKLATIA